METHKRKEKAIAELQEKQQESIVNEEDGLTISQLSLNWKNASDPATQAKKKKPLEIKRKVLKVNTKHLFQTRKGNKQQAISHKVVKTSRTFNLKRVMMEGLSKRIEVNDSVMERAKEVQASLAADLPSFLKRMQPSHCGRGFFLKLPKDFCNLHLPTYDTKVTLVDESEQQYAVTFLSERLALSGGWRWFVRNNNLIDGDVLVFQLIGPLFFKVYIIREHSLDELDGALGLLNLDTVTACSYLNKAENKENPGSDASRHTVDLLVNDKETKGAENFSIVVNGSTVDSELSEHQRIKYYELCSKQKQYLHEGLPMNIHCKLAAELISEIINISDGLESCSSSTPRDDYVLWDRTLEGFEVLGMKVGFLRIRLNQLAGLSSGSAETNLYRETKMEQARIDEESKALKEKLRELKKQKKQLNAKMESLRENVERRELMFQREANAPW